MNHKNQNKFRGKCVEHIYFSDLIKIVLKFNIQFIKSVLRNNYLRYSENILPTYFNYL